MVEFSIITPFYNSEKYLRKCVESVLGQTFCDFEFILVDDGSNDSSLEIVKEFLKKDKRIIYFSKENEGQGIARNLALKYAKGRYVLYLDADDWLLDDALNKLNAKFQKDKSDIVFFNVYKFYEKNLKKNEHRYIDYYSKFNEAPFCVLDAKDILFNSNALPFKAYRREFLVNNNIKYSPTRFIEDSEFYIKAMLCADKISCLDEYILNYRVHKSSTTFKNAKRISTIKNTFFVCENILNNSEYKDIKEIRHSFLKNRISQIFYYYSILDRKYKRTYFYMIKKILKYIKQKYGFDFVLKDFQKDRFSDIINYSYEIYRIKRFLISFLIFFKNYVEI